MRKLQTDLSVSIGDLFYKRKERRKDGRKEVGSKEKREGEKKDQTPEGETSMSFKATRLVKK